MVSASCLLDTDILIDWLQGRSWTKEVISSRSVPLYCSAVTRKELLSKPGISSAERERILRLLHVVRVINVDSVIAAAASELLMKYPNAPLRVNDALIAATAWVKRLPLLTRNRKHYEFIAEITLADLPRTSDSVPL
jgi:predicted nucleic acid-binding protein